jgi:hypothetical protein
MQKQQRQKEQRESTLVMAGRVLDWALGRSLNGTTRNLAGGARASRAARFSKDLDSVIVSGRRRGRRRSTGGVVALGRGGHVATWAVGIRVVTAGISTAGVRVIPDEILSTQGLNHIGSSIRGIQHVLHDRVLSLLLGGRLVILVSTFGRILFAIHRGLQ